MLSNLPAIGEGYNIPDPAAFADKHAAVLLFTLCVLEEAVLCGHRALLPLLTSHSGELNSTKLADLDWTTSSSTAGI